MWTRQCQMTNTLLQWATILFLYTRYYRCLLLSALNWHWMHTMQVFWGRKKRRYHENIPSQSRINAENKVIDFLAAHRSFGMYSRDRASSILGKNKNRAIRTKMHNCIITSDILRGTDDFATKTRPSSKNLRWCGLLRMSGTSSSHTPLFHACWSAHVLIDKE